MMYKFIENVRYITWVSGIHWYAKIGKLDICDEQGNYKWNTKTEAIEAAKWWIKKLTMEDYNEYGENDIFFDREYTDEEILTPKEYYIKHKGEVVSYKGVMNGEVAGYVEHYIIIGFDNERGCIKSFSPQVVYDKKYKSYRFAKMKNITPF